MTDSLTDSAISPDDLDAPDPDASVAPDFLEDDFQPAAFSPEDDESEPVEEPTERERLAAGPIRIDDMTRRALCPACREPMEQRSVGAFNVWFPLICPTCEAAQEREIALRSAREISQNREATVRAEIPPQYRLLADQLLSGHLAPKPGRFPEAAWERLRRWYPHEPTDQSLIIEMGRGICLAGDTGHYKTTIACALLARTHRVMGWSIAYLHAGEFGEAVQDKQAWKDDPTLRSRARAKLKQAREARLLVIDDLGKEQSTATIYKQLKILVEDRCAHLRPTIVTTQLNAKDLAATIGAADGYTGRALIRRLQDVCELVPVG